MGKPTMKPVHSIDYLHARKVHLQIFWLPSSSIKYLLKLYIYGYLNRVRSSRRLLRECVRNIEVMWLIHRLAPDFRTIADFRKDNRLAIRNAFRAFVKVLDEMKLFRKEIFAVDGTKIRANNSIKKSFTPELLTKKLAYLAQQEKQLEA